MEREPAHSPEKTDDAQRKEKLTAAFNRLSFFDKWKLRGAAATMTITNVFNKDIQKSPWLFPVYAGMASIGLAFSILPGPNVLPFAVLAGYCAVSPTKWARDVQKRLSDAFFNKAKLLEDHRPFVREHKDVMGKDHLLVDDKGLGSHTWSTVKKDFKQATIHTYKALTNCFKGASRNRTMSNTHKPSLQP